MLLALFGEQNLCFFSLPFFLLLMKQIPKSNPKQNKQKNIS
jgi:hypothetical protein